MVHQLTRNLTEDQIKQSPFATYFVDHTTGVYPIAASGVPFRAEYFQSKGDVLTDLHEDLAAEQKARTTYDNLLRLIDDPAFDIIGMCPKEITDTAYYRMDTLMMAHMAKLTGRDEQPYLSLAEDIRRQYAGADCAVLTASAKEKHGLDALRAIMQGESCCCLTGQSGVGKSTLLNALLGLELETGEISEKIQRGKNTTRHAQMLIHKAPEGDIRVLDTAGFSLLELDAKMEPDKLRECYPEFLEHEGCCRFTPCMHDREPGCSVTAAVNAGEIDAGRVERYRLLLSDVRETWKQRYN